METDKAAKQKAIPSPKSMTRPMRRTARFKYYRWGKIKVGYNHLSTTPGSFTRNPLKRVRGTRTNGVGRFSSHQCPTSQPVILIIIGIPSPTHSFTLGLNPSFSANPPYRSLSFVSFTIHYMYFPDCLLLLLSISVFLLFSFFSVFTLF